YVEVRNSQFEPCWVQLFPSSKVWAHRLMATVSNLGSAEVILLLVEDSADDAALAQRAFAKTTINTRVVVAPGGAEALNYLFAIGDYRDRSLPDLILLDLKMPRLNGFEVLRQLRANQITELLPVVVFSSSVEPEDRHHSYLLHANSYIRKPLGLAEFSDAAQLLSDYWFGVNEGQL